MLTFLLSIFAFESIYAAEADQTGSAAASTSANLSAETGWKTIAGKKYYFTSSGKARTGWFKLNEKKYYLNPQDGGACVTGFFQINGAGFYFTREGELLKNTFIKLDDQTYYYAKKSGKLRTGLAKIENAYYYFDPETYKMQFGWVKAASGGKTYSYYMKSSGTEKGQAVTGWMELEGSRYCFSRTGKMVTGWASVGTKKYYFDDSSGKMYTGVHTISGTSYTFHTTEGYLSTAETATGTWLIKVNQSTCTVTIYRGTYPVKAFACSVGANGATPDGTYWIMDHLRWHELMGPSWGQWCSHFSPDMLFHSIPYNRQNDKYSMSINGYNLLGQPASHGCIRLAAINAKYIYDNVPVGTKVVVFHGSSSDDPLGKPQTPYVGSWGHSYDPTDPTISSS